MAKPTSNSKKRATWRRHLRFTREGRVFVFVTFGLGFAAVNTGTNLMYLVFGFMLSLIVLSGILSEHVLRRLRVERSLPSRAFVGQPALIEVQAFNGKERLVSYSVEVEDQAVSEPNERRCYFLKVPPGQSQAATYRRVPQRRGILEFAAFRVSTRFPFGLFEKWREFDAPAELLVYPALLPTRLPEGVSREEGHESGASKGRGTETRELREYRVGDEVRSIHWRRSAAMGKPVVREYEREAAALFCFVLDNHVPDAADRQAVADVEAQISRVAYLVERALARGASAEVCARGARSPRLNDASSPDPIWRFLALLPVEPSKQGLALPSRGARVIDVRSLEDLRAEAAE